MDQIATNSDTELSQLLESSRSERLAHRFLSGLSPDDRADVLQSARLWAWEHRHLAPRTRSSSSWFVGIVRNQRRQLLRQQHTEPLDGDADAPQGDTTLAHAEAVSSAEALGRALPPDYRRVAQLEAAGYSRSEMVKLGLSKHTVDEARSRVRQLRRLVPDEHDFRPSPATPAARGSDHAFGEPGDDDTASGWPAIDIEMHHQLTELDHRPRLGPDDSVPRSSDPDVRAAVEATEARRSGPID